MEEDPNKKPKKAAKKQPARKARPKKAAKSSPKKSNKKAPPTSYDTSFGSLSSLTQLFAQGETQAMKSRRMSMKAIGGNLQEHLDSFILIGYTMTGEPVQMMFAPTPKDIDSLSTNLQKFILDSGGPGGFQ